MENLFKTISLDVSEQLKIYSIEKGFKVEKLNDKEETTYTFYVSNHDIVMLLNYYLACKGNVEPSKYILKGSVNEDNSFPKEIDRLRELKDKVREQAKQRREKKKQRQAKRQSKK